MDVGRIQFVLLAAFEKIQILLELLSSKQNVPVK